MALKVNTEPVDEELIHQEFSQIKSWHEQQHQVNCCERDDEFMAQAKENIIGRLLLRQEAMRHIPGLTRSEIDTAIDQLKKECGGETEFFAQTGFTPDQMDLAREQVAIRGRVDKLVDRICAADRVPELTELEDFYRCHIDLYTTDERIRAQHIFKSFRQAGDREGLFRECCRVRRQLVGGADFVETARRFSDKPAEEIDLGFFKRGELMDEFEFVAFSLQVGEVSPVFGSFHGFHLAKLVAREPAQPEPFEKIRDRVVQDFTENLRQQKLNQYVEHLKENAVIEDSDKEVSSTVPCEPESSGPSGKPPHPHE